ncbi:hypothetical protein H4S14_002462 [Agrobacterium vitis]|nr:hypothetical protein [Agrobacterium vitis]MBE1438706.1 hypothetical protein [Agrobacterium vitis]
MSSGFELPSRDALAPTVNPADRNLPSENGLNDLRIGRLDPAGEIADAVDLPYSLNAGDVPDNFRISKF